MYSSPLGPIRIAASDKGICSVDMMFGKHYSNSPPIANECSGNSSESSRKHITMCLQWLESYFCGDRDGTKAHMPQLDLPHNGMTIVLILATCGDLILSALGLHMLCMCTCRSTTTIFIR